MFSCRLQASIVKGTDWVARAGARIGERDGERERRIWAPVTSPFIPQIDVGVKPLGTIWAKRTSCI